MHARRPADAVRLSLGVPRATGLLPHLAGPPDMTMSSVQRRQQRHAAHLRRAVGAERHAPAQRLSAATDTDLAHHAVLLETLQQTLPLIPMVLPPQVRPRHGRPTHQIWIVPAQAPDGPGARLVVLRSGLLTPEPNVHEATQVCHWIQARKKPGRNWHARHHARQDVPHVAFARAADADRLLGILAWALPTLEHFPHALVDSQLVEDVKSENGARHHDVHAHHKSPHKRHLKGLTERPVRGQKHTEQLRGNLRTPLIGHAIALQCIGIIVLRRRGNLLLLLQGGRVQLVPPLLLAPPRRRCPPPRSAFCGGARLVKLPHRVERGLRVQRRWPAMPLAVRGKVRQPALLIVLRLLARPVPVLHAPRLVGYQPIALAVQRHLQFRAQALVETLEAARAHVAQPNREQTFARTGVGGVALRPAPVLLHERLHLVNALPRRPPLPRAPVHQLVEARAVLLAQLVLAHAHIVDPPRELCFLLVLRPSLRQFLQHVHVLLDAVQHRAGARVPRLLPVHEGVEPLAPLRGQHVLTFADIMDPCAERGLALQWSATVLGHVALQGAQHLLHVIP